jgi:hypothetical protein
MSRFYKFSTMFSTSLKYIRGVTYLRVRSLPVYITLTIVLQQKPPFCRNAYLEPIVIRQDWPKLEADSQTHPSKFCPRVKSFVTFHNNNTNNSIEFFIIYVPSQQPQGQLQTQHSVGTIIQ